MKRKKISVFILEVLPYVLQLQQVYLLLLHLYLNSVEYRVFQVTWELSELPKFILDVVGHFLIRDVVGHFRILKVDGNFNQI